MTPTPHKRCKGMCQRVLPVDAEHFSRHAHSRDGYMAQCRRCRDGGWSEKVKRREQEERRERARGARAARIVARAEESLRGRQRRQAA